MKHDLNNLREFNLEKAGELVSVEHSGNDITLYLTNKIVKFGLEESSDGLELVSYFEVEDVSNSFSEQNNSIFITDVDVYTSGVTVSFSNDKVISIEVIYENDDIETAYAENRYKVEAVVM